MPVIPQTDGAQFREQIAREAESLWLNPPDLAYIRADKGWHTDQPDWCGEFAGLAAGMAGLAQSIRRYCTPSTYRLQSAEKWEDAKRPRPTKPARGDVRRGDIICVVTGEGKSYGDHIAVVYAVMHDKIYTIEGNARGLLPSGEESTRRRVVKQVRRMKDVRQIIRFDDSHRGE